MSISFRPCVADDVDLAVPLIYSSGPAAFRFVFSQQHEQQALAFLRVAFHSGRGEFGYQRHIAVVRDGQLIGIGALLLGRHRRSDFIAVLRQIVAFYRLDCWRVLHRGIVLERVIQPPHKQVAIIAHLGIQPEYRGQGIGAQLLNYLLQRCRQAGYSRAGLDVALANPRAQKLYEGLGFAIVRTSHAARRSAFGELKDHHYMEINLAPGQSDA